AYNGAGRIIETVDGEDNTTRYEYDEVGNLIRESDPLGRITQHVYDLNNQKIKTIDAAGYITAFAYDPNGNQTAVIWPDQSEVYVFYDALNRKIGRTNELGHQELFEYDPAGNLLRHTDARGNATAYEYDAAGRRVSTIDAKNQATAVAYDEAGRTLQTTDALGVITDRQYDVHGNLVKLTQALGTNDESVTRYQYDDNNRQTHEIRELKVDASTTRDLVTQFQYDDRGLLRYRTEGQHLGNDAETTEFRYNAKGELIETIDPEGNLTAYTYDKAGRKIKTSVTTAAGGLTEHTWEYDQAGNVILEVLPEGETIVKGYDPFNRLNFELLGTDQRHLEYDSRGRLVNETNFNNVITQYEYDAAGRLTARTDAWDNPDQAVTRYTYDENGNTLTITNARNKLISYEYNELNQVIRKTDSDSTYTDYTYDAEGGVKTIKRQDKTVITYLRDNLGRVAQVTADGSLRQAFAYDTLSRMKSATDNNQGRATHTVDYVYNDLSRAKTEIQDGYTVTRQFDGNGNKTRITYPSARVVDKAYDENNMLLEVRYQGSLVAQATYDKNSRLAYAAYGNNTDLSLEYDADRGRESYRGVTTPYADPLFSVSGMVYDGQNNLTEKTEYFNATTLDEALEYDPLDRLISRNRGTVPEVTWDYDEAGNWTATNQNGTAETRTVTDDNEYDLVGARVPVHDDRGNMTFDGSRSFEYDWTNRLIKITSGNQTLAEYTYDALNRRVTKTVGADTTTYVYDGADVVEAYLNGTLIRVFAFGGDVDDPILMEYDGQDYYFARDRLGSIRAVTDSTGALVESYEYSPFGLMKIFDNQGQDITATGSTIGNPYGYTGRRWDGESGLWYYRNRMYSAELGRFLQRDPAGYVDGLNLYAYVLNNPLQYTDPDGLMARNTIQWMSDHPLPGPDDLLSSGLHYLSDKLDQQTTTNWGDQLGATILKTTVDVGAGIVDSPEAFANQVYDWSKDFKNLNKLPVLGPLGTAIGESWAKASINPSFKNYSKAIGNTAFGLSTALGGAQLSRSFNFSSQGSQASNSADVQFAGGRSPWTADLSNVTGKASQARNSAINAIIKEDFSNLKLTYTPQYSPFASQGVAKKGIGTQIGKQSFSSRQQLRDTVVHEELHHRWWKRGVDSPHHSPDAYVPNEKFYDVIKRYNQIRGWE
ncbi:MAG: hypothetical protein MI799_06685, partial [Desulfobacterales bacterium]|nr:hypothetical protein [Desulfobacterales bacterium]